MQVQALSTIKTIWIEELRKTYPKDPHLQQLIKQFHEETLDPIKYHL